MKKDFIMRCFVFTSVLLAILFSTTNAQQVTYNKTLPLENATAKAVYVLDSNHYLVAGSQNKYGHDKDALVAMTDGDGNMLWSATFGGHDADQFNSIAKTPRDYFILAGYTKSYGYKMPDFFAVKINSSGDRRWLRTYGDLGSDICYNVEHLYSNKFVLTGKTSPYIPPRDGKRDADIVALKINHESHIIWGNRYGTSKHEIAFESQLTANGNLVFAGYRGQNKRKAYVMKTNANGKKLWEKNLSKQDYSMYASGIVKSGNHNLLLVGGKNRLYSSYQHPTFTKLRSNGQVIFNKTLSLVSKDQQAKALSAYAGKGFGVTGFGNGPTQKSFFAQVDDHGTVKSEVILVDNENSLKAEDLANTGNERVIITGTMQLKNGENRIFLAKLKPGAKRETRP